MRAYEIRPEGVRARVDDSADSMKYRSLTEEEEEGEGRAHRRSRIPRFSVLSNGPIRAKSDGRTASGPRRGPAWVTSALGVVLLDLDLRALLFEGRLDLVGLVAG